MWGENDFLRDFYTSTRRELRSHCTCCLPSQLVSILPAHSKADCSHAWTQTRPFSTSPRFFNCPSLASRRGQSSAFSRRSPPVCLAGVFIPLSFSTARGPSRKFLAFTSSSEEVLRLASLPHAEMITSLYATSLYLTTLTPINTNSCQIRRKSHIKIYTLCSRGYAAPPSLFCRHPIRACSRALPHLRRVWKEHSSSFLPV